MKEELSDIDKIRDYLSHIWRKDIVKKWSDAQVNEYYKLFKNGFFNLK